jgi:predicted AAA+ superfamily ATPase
MMKCSAVQLRQSKFEEKRASLAYFIASDDNFAKAQLHKGWDAASHRRCPRISEDAGDQPRHRANRLFFLAADQAVLGRLKDAMRAGLAWESIVADVEGGRLNIGQNQKTQAVKESQAAAAVLPRVARECFRFKSQEWE